MDLSKIDLGELERFEASLDPRHPEARPIPARVLGYGEISAVLEIGLEGWGDYAFKRLPMFETEAEAKAYCELFDIYVRRLRDEVGIRVLPSDVVTVRDKLRDRVVVYIIQEKVHAFSVGNKLLHTLPSEAIRNLVDHLLGELEKVYRFNLEHRGEVELGFDGQISNWAVLGLNQAAEELPAEPQLAYFDVSTPLMQVTSVEQLNPELFLRSAPSFLVWVIRRLFLEDVMTRYYDFRKVVLDLVANFHKEQKPELIPELIARINRRFADRAGELGWTPLSEKDVLDYYREDALIWRFYLGARKVDRWLQERLGRYYPYMLPESIER